VASLLALYWVVSIEYFWASVSIPILRNVDGRIYMELSTFQTGS